METDLIDQSALLIKKMGRYHYPQVIIETSTRTICQTYEDLIIGDICDAEDILDEEMRQENSKEGHIIWEAQGILRRITIRIKPGNIRIRTMTHLREA